MTKVKLCGLTRFCDIEAANEVCPEYIGFVFAPKSKRFITPERVKELKQQLSPHIQAVGVFVNAPLETVANLLETGVIDMAQLHGEEDEAYIQRLRKHTACPIIKAFRAENPADMEKANESSADFVLLDSQNGGSGTVFDWALLEYIQRPYFLAGGLNVHNVTSAIQTFRPYAVDISSGIEKNGCKDPRKMAEFVLAVRKEREK